MSTPGRKRKGIMSSGFEGLWKWLAHIYSLPSMKASLEGLSLSESVWITPLCAATHDRRLGSGNKWQTQKEIGSGFTINLNRAVVSLFLYLSPFSFYMWLHEFNTKGIFVIYFSVEQKTPQQHISSPMKLNMWVKQPIYCAWLCNDTIFTAKRTVIWTVPAVLMQSRYLIIYLLHCF